MACLGCFGSLPVAQIAVVSGQRWGQSGSSPGPHELGTVLDNPVYTQHSPVNTLRLLLLAAFFLNVW